MSSSEQTVIPFSKSKLIRLLFFGVLFIAGGLWLAITQPETSNPFFNDPILKTVVGILATLMGVLGIFFSIQKMIDPRPALIISSSGFTDNSSALSAGFIAWSEVDSITTTSVRKQKFIVIRLKDPRKYVEKQTSAWKRKLLELNYNNYGSPINISPNAVLYKFEELFLLFHARFKESNDIPGIAPNSPATP